MGAAYRGLLGAYPFAFRRTASWLFRSYVLVSAIVGGFIALVLGLGLVTWLGGPGGLVGQNALLGVIGLFLLVPLAAPVLIVARRHRFGDDRPRVDALFAGSGYAFILSIYVALLITDPNPHAVTGPLGTVIAVLDGLPRRYGLVPPVLATVAILAVARLTRPAGTDAA